MEFIVFYLIGCIIAYLFKKDDNTNLEESEAKTSISTQVLLSWITVAKFLYERYISRFK